MLFTFPSRYFSAIGQWDIFSLRRWSSLIHARFLVSRATRVLTQAPSSFRLQDFHLLRLSFPAYSANFPDTLLCKPHYPTHLIISARFRLIPFRSPLLRESLLFSLPPGTEMFHFPGFASRLRRMMKVYSIGLPHSDIYGSKLV